MKINQQYIKNSNIKQIYSQLQKKPGESRAGLAKITGLSKTTVSSLTEELVLQGFVMDSGTASSTNVGRKPNQLYLTGDRHCVITVNWEPHSLSAALVCLNGSISAQVKIEIQSPAGYFDMLEEIVDIVQKQNREEVKVIGLCMILPAMIDSKKHRIISTVLELGEETEVIDRVCKTFPQFPVAFYNDTACYAYAEKIYSGRQDESFVFINMNQGIGAAFFFDGKMFGGASGMQTQLGHYCVEVNGISCACGNSGCLEVMIGEKALRRIADEFGVRSLDKKQEIHYIDVVEAVNQGDQAACLMISKIADYLSRGLSNLISLIRPDRIVIGGAGVGLGEDFLKELTDSIKMKGFHQMVNEVDIIYSGLGNEACLRGAMKYFFDYNFIFTEDMVGRIFLG